jgi:hypothetical protein
MLTYRDIFFRVKKVFIQIYSYTCFEKNILTSNKESLSYKAILLNGRCVYISVELKMFEKPTMRQELKLKGQSPDRDGPIWLQALIHKLASYPPPPPQPHQPPHNYKS